MKVLYRWLLEMCDLPTVPTPDEVAKALTRGGLEVEGMTDLGGGFSGVVVAEVVAKRPHPDADKLTLVDVITEIGGAPTQVVCGAPNVPEPGRKVLWAQIGAKLPGKEPLAAKAIKGVSSPGMLCAEDELGLGDDHAGIVVLDADDRTALGAPAQQALFLDDWMMEISAPANRGDVLGHLGVARDLCAMLGGRLVPPDATIEETAGATIGVAIDDPAICARYTARFIEGVTVGPSPRRIAARLTAVGVRPISNLVDVTNYVLFELGQPLHAFDADTVKGPVSVGHAHDGEQFTTLDKANRTLVPADLVIRDGARTVALAGVMGGLATEVTRATTRVLLEAASFDAKSVRRTAKRLNLRSEASLRFERGVDPELAALASARAAHLLVALAGGRVGALVEAYPGRRTPAPIRVRLARVRMLSGIPGLDAATCTGAIARLGCEVVADGDTFAVTPPSARPDIAREVDVIEEILRVVGFEHVPSSLPVMRQAPPLTERDAGDLARLALAAAGLDEAITFAFQSVERCQALGVAATDHRAQPISLRNPMTIDQAVMRTSLVPNLVAAVARNHSFGRPDVAIFECGSVFLRRGESVADRPPPNLMDIAEPAHAAGVLAGHRPGHIGDGAAWDVFDAKAYALVAIRAVAGDVRVTERAVHDVAWLHPGVAGELAVGAEVVAWFGEVHPRMRKALGATGGGPIFAFDVDLEKLHRAGHRKMVAIPKFPSSTRDVSLLLDAAIPAGEVRTIIDGANEPLVMGARLLEDYRGDKLPAGTKSMLWTIAYRAGDRTLTDVEVDKAHEAIVGRLVENLPAQRR